MCFISVTLDTSHSPIGPCGPLEQSPLGDSFQHSPMALLTSDSNRGENTGVTLMPRVGAGVTLMPGVGADVHDVRDIDPSEPSNMSCLVALE